MNDPSAQYLEVCSPIGTPRRHQTNLGSDLDEQELEYRVYQKQRVPSPSANIDECRPFTIDRLVTRVKEEEGKTGEPGEEDKDQLASPKTPVIDLGDAAPRRACKVAPAVALFNQKLKRKMEEDYRRL